MRAISEKQYYRQFFEEFRFNTDVSTRLIAIDIVNVMSAVYYADISIDKTPPRTINVDVPVYSVQKWNKCKPFLLKLLKWVSEDDFFLSFSENTLVEQTKEEYLNNTDQNYTITLFSGGLDSFAGAYYNLKNGVHSEYIGFVNKGEERTKQKRIRNFYHKVFPDSSVYLLEKHSIKKEYLTQSTRSLLYMSLAVAKALTDRKYKKVQIYENGVLSLNPELKGRYTTKTTHPQTIHTFNKLLQQLGINIGVENPFIFKTKGQIFADLPLEFKNQIANTYTCGQGRINSKYNHKGQCGVCIPCLLRKISLAANELEPYDSDYYYPYEVKLKDISEDKFRKDYASNFEYFNEYTELVKRGNIFSHLQIRSTDYNEPLALEKTKDMLEVFVQEFERFRSRYAPY